MLGIDNNLTRKVSEADALFIAGLKGLVAGVVNTALALLLGAQLPTGNAAAGALAVGLFGYGISLTLFVLALRGLDATRTGAYFSTAPFMGAAVAILLFGDHAPPAFWLAAALMALGVWVHLSERHDHIQTHPAALHEHVHVHDEHHRHYHANPADASRPHSHPHRHETLTHQHPHYPDVDHRHDH